MTELFTYQGKCMLQLCYIITDSKSFLWYNKQVSHWLKWDEFVVEGPNHMYPKDENFTVPT